MRQGFNSIRTQEREEQLRESIAGTLVDSGYIWRPTRTPDGAGGFTLGHALVTANAPMAANVHTPGEEDLVASKVTGKTMYVVHLLPDQEIGIDYKITIHGQTHWVVELDYSVTVEIARTVYTVVNK